MTGAVDSHLRTAQASGVVASTTPTLREQIFARAARDDIEAAERHLAEQMTEESWVPLQRRVKALEEGTSSDPAAEGSDTESS